MRSAGTPRFADTSRAVVGRRVRKRTEWSLLCHVAYCLAIAVPAIAHSTPASALTEPTTIDTIEELQNVSNDLSGDYILGQDIDASVTSTWNGGAGFIPIGEGPSGVVIGSFTGTLNGNGHSISNLAINGKPLNLFGGQAAPFGLIGNLQGTIMNLGLLNAHVSGGGAGIVAGDNEGTISRVYSTGSVAVSGPPDATQTFITDAGGLVAFNSGTISQSYSRASITASVAAEAHLGGLVGYNFPGSKITQSYSLGDVTSNLNSFVLFGTIGGIVGSNDAGEISEAYASGKLTASEAGAFLLLGGISGSSRDDLLDDTPARELNSYWDISRSGVLTDGGTLTDSHNVTGLTTAQLQSGVLPAGFDPNVWRATQGQYPTLQWQTTSSTPLPLLATTAAQLSKLAYLSLAVIQSGALPPGYVIPAGYAAIDAYQGTGAALGLDAVAFRGPDGNITVAFRGTHPGSDEFSAQFWTDTGFSGVNTPASSLPTYLSQAQDFIKALGANVSHLTGLSLGGGVAQILGSISGLDTVTFNAPGGKFDVQQLQACGVLPSGPAPTLNKNVVNYRTLGDIISLLPGPDSQLGTVVTLPTDASLNPITPQVFWGPFHNIDTVIGSLSSAPLSTLVPDSNGNTDTTSLLFEEEADFGIDIAQGLSVLGSVVGGAVIDGIDHFTADVTAGVLKAFHVDDPPNLEGFDFTTGRDNPNFASLLLPDQLDPYDVRALISGAWMDLGIVQPLSSLDFGPGGVSEFRIDGVDADPNFPLIFIVGLSFIRDGLFTGTATPIYETAPVPEPASWMLLVSSCCLIMILHNLKLSTIREWRGRPALATIRIHRNDGTPIQALLCSQSNFRPISHTLALPCRLRNASTGGVR